MAQNKRNVPKYVYDIPYFERMELCRILDQNDKWEELGGIHMNFDMLTIQTLRREILRGNSPTDELLTKWGHQNHTILELFVLLSKMQHYQAMLTIKQFVDSEYHRLIYEGEQNLSRIFKAKPNSKFHSSNTVKALQPSGRGENSNAGNNQINSNNNNNKNNNNNMSDNMNFSRSLNNISDKVSFNGSQSVNNNAEKKILNGQEEPPSNGNVPTNNGNDRNNAQTVLMNRAVNDGENESRDQYKYLKPDSAKDKIVSEISCIAESVGILPVITFKELEIATNGWDHSTILGKGGFGTVYKGSWKNTSVAIKRTRNSDTDENHSVQIQQILGELRLLNSYRHDNILPLYGFSMDGEHPCLIYQFMPNGSLEDRLLCRHGTKPLSWFQRHNIATGTARGLQFLHTIGEKPLIHGDIKTANILLDSNFEPKIGDFGLAREGPYSHYTHMKVSRVHGTRPYLPDEFLRHKKFSTKVDTHSFGIVLFELGTGLRAYDDQRSYKFLKDLIENTQYSQLGNLIDKKCGPDEQQTFMNLIALGKFCVSRKPKDRPEMVVVLQELNAMAVKRDMLVKVQSMIRQNSLTPSNPYEMQVLHDHMSLQKRMSPTLSNTNQYRAPTRAISPLQPTLFNPDRNAIGNAASLEAQAAYNYNNFNNNPFLPLEPLRNENEKKTSKEVQGISPGNTKENVGPNVTENRPASRQMEVPQQKVVVNQELGNELKIKTPVISVSPPSTSQTSASSEEDEDIVVPPPSTPNEYGQTDQDLDYEFMSDAQNFLPLISVLGVKPKSEVPKEENKKEEKESKEDVVDSEDSEEQKTESSTGETSKTEAVNVEVNTSAKGKPLWILDDPS